MGFECRERFYAGAQAGWGAQVLEHPQCRFVVFADVDMSPGEVTGDFSHEGLAPRQELGTVGMWCKLHGEAVLHAGLHHLECQFDFDAVADPARRGGYRNDGAVYRLPVPTSGIYRGRTVVDRLESSGATCAARDGSPMPNWMQFALHGARGSHLEILERNDGYKGFNQTGISEIIAKTDPRNAAAGR